MSYTISYRGEGKDGLVEYLEFLLIRRNTPVQVHLITVTNGMESERDYMVESITGEDAKVLNVRTYEINWSTADVIIGDEVFSIACSDIEYISFGD